MRYSVAADIARNGFAHPPFAKKSGARGVEVNNEVQAVPGGDEVVDAYLSVLTVTLADDGISPRTRRAASHAYALFQ